MSGWWVFWICLCILLAGPSMSGIAAELRRIAVALEEANRLTKQRRP